MLSSKDCHCVGHIKERNLKKIQLFLWFKIRGATSFLFGWIVQSNVETITFIYNKYYEYILIILIYFQQCRGHVMERKLNKVQHGTQIALMRPMGHVISSKHHEKKSTFC